LDHEEEDSAHFNPHTFLFSDGTVGQMQHAWPASLYAASAAAHGEMQEEKHKSRASRWTRCGGVGVGLERSFETFSSNMYTGFLLLLLLLLLSEILSKTTTKRGENFLANVGAGRLYHHLT
jgi:hypothetical protein